MQNNRVQHITISPYYPLSNWLPKRDVQTFKPRIKKLTKGTMETRVTWALFHYCNMPHTSTGQSPAELILRRQLRTCLTPARESEHTRSSRRESTMLTPSQGSSSLGHISTARTLAKGHHGSLGSSKSPRAQCLALSSCKMVMSYDNTWTVESSHSYSTTISSDVWLPHHRVTITEPRLAASWSTTFHSKAESLHFLPATQVTRLLCRDG